MKNNRFGKATVVDKSQELLIRENLPKLIYQVVFDVARFTGERAGAILKLELPDVYDPWGKPLTFITFRKTIRKRSGGKEAKTRQLAMHPKLAESLRGWKSESEVWLFPGRSPDKPLSFSSYDKALRQACTKAGLDHEGISTHTTRRTMMNRLRDKGVGTETIQKVIGHADIRMTARYLDDNPELERQVILDL